MESRDVTSVFPTEGRNSASNEVQKLEEGVKTRFISESELEGVKESEEWADYGRKEDAGKTLAEILAENKRRKDEEFQEHWKSMKQGKNRPLDPEDFEFVQNVFQEDFKKTKEQFEQQQQDVEEFRKAREEILTLPAEQKPVMEQRVKKPVRKTGLIGLKSKPKVKAIPKKRTSPSSMSEQDKKLKKSCR